MAHPPPHRPRGRPRRAAHRRLLRAHRRSLHLEGKRLVVLAEEINGGVNEEFILAHEYTHSLQDRTYDLVALHEAAEDDETTELSTTTSCVIEGDASLAAVYYLTEKYGDTWTERLGDEPEDEDPDRPPALEYYSLFNYSQCLSFIVTLQLLKGWDGVNGLLQDPPVSTEQILHPERYIRGEAPLPVDLLDLEAALGDDWSLMQGAAYGEFDAFVYLAAAGVEEAEARDAAEGWGGGHMRVFTQEEDDGNGVLIHIALVWDSEVDWGEFEVAYQRALFDLEYDDYAIGGKQWRFESPGEYGAAFWDKAARRVDILVSTERDALEAVIETSAP